MPQELSHGTTFSFRLLAPGCQLWYRGSATHWPPALGEPPPVMVPAWLSMLTTRYTLLWRTPLGLGSATQNVP
ncbi:hypothetical protein D3C86_2030680 [compost metagenome]